MGYLTGLINLQFFKQPKSHYTTADQHTPAPPRVNSFFYQLFYTQTWSFKEETSCCVSGRIYCKVLLYFWLYLLHDSGLWYWFLGYRLLFFTAYSVAIIFLWSITCHHLHMKLAKYAQCTLQVPVFLQEFNFVLCWRLFWRKKLFDFCSSNDPLLWVLILWRI